MQNLVAISEEYKKEADRLLKETGLVEYLSKFGKVHFAGAYSYGLMMHGDIDIYVIRDKRYSIEGVFEIFKKLYFQDKFRSHFIGGDWDDLQGGKKVANAYYIGLKQRIGDERWKFDIWFLSQADFDALPNKDYFQDKSMTNEQKKLILECKQYRNNQKLPVESQTIYELVMNGHCKSLKDFETYCSNK